VADKDPLILDFRNGRVLDGADLDEYYVSGPDDEPTNWDDAPRGPGRSGTRGLMMVP